VRAGLIAAARRNGALISAMRFKRVGGLKPLDLRGIGLRADDHEIVVHDEPARGAVSFSHPGLLGLRRVSKQQHRLRPSALLQDVAAAGDDGLTANPDFLAKASGQDAQDSAILRGRRGQDDELVRFTGCAVAAAAELDEGRPRSPRRADEQSGSCGSLLRDAVPEGTMSIVLEQVRNRRTGQGGGLASAPRRRKE